MTEHTHALREELTNRQFHAAALQLGPLPLRLLGSEVLTALGDVAN
jgi:uncharacterized protein (DUF885 family)